MQDLDLTPKMATVLKVFLEDPDQPRYGFELMKLTGLASGSLYPMLARLEGAPADQGQGGHRPARRRAPGAHALHDYRGGRRCRAPPARRAQRAVPAARPRAAPPAGRRRVTGLLWAALGVLGGFGLAAIGDMVSEEVRDRFDHVPHAILRLAVRRLDPAERVPSYDEEWLPELTYILQGDESRPVTRLYHGTRFAVGILLTVRRITRNRHRVAPVAGTARGALSLDERPSGNGFFPVRRTVRHLVLGAQLRRLREGAGITRLEVAARLSDSPSEASLMENKIGLMEYGREEFVEDDIADLLTLYGVGPGTRREWLLRIAREVNVPGVVACVLGHPVSLGRAVP